MSSATQLCPSCAGQIAVGTASCPWCGIGLTASEATRVAAAPPPPVVASPSIGFGDRASRPLPPLPPPPKSLPLVKLNGTQMFLRAMIVLGCVYLLFVIGREFVVFSACAVPGSPLCR